MMTGASFDITALSSTRPTPGRENSVSMTVVPTSSDPTIAPETVRAGITEWRRPWRSRTRAGLAPRVRAVSVCGCSSVSSRRSRRIWPSTPASGSDRVRAGSTSEASPSAPVEGKIGIANAKTLSRMRPIQNDGTAIAMSSSPCATKRATRPRPADTSAPTRAKTIARIIASPVSAAVGGRAAAMISVTGLRCW